MVAANDGASVVFASVPDLYWQRGYVNGHRQAVSDMLATLVPLTEEFIRGRPDQSAVELRKLLYAYEEHLERELVRLRGETGYVSDGLGI